MNVTLEKNSKNQSENRKLESYLKPYTPIKIHFNNSLKAEPKYSNIKTSNILSERQNINTEQNSNLYSSTNWSAIIGQSLGRTVYKSNISTKDVKEVKDLRRSTFNTIVLGCPEKEDTNNTNNANIKLTQHNVANAYVSCNAFSDQIGTSKEVKEVKERKDKENGLNISSNKKAKIRNINTNIGDYNSKIQFDNNLSKIPSSSIIDADKPVINSVNSLFQNKNLIKINLEDSNILNLKHLKRAPAFPTYKHNFNTFSNTFTEKFYSSHNINPYSPRNIKIEPIITNHSTDKESFLESEAEALSNKEKKPSSQFQPSQPSRTSTQPNNNTNSLYKKYPKTNLAISIDKYTSFEKSGFPNTNKDMLKIAPLNFEPIDIMTLIGEQFAHIPINAQLLRMNFPNIEQSKCSLKTNGIIRSYAANTHQGNTRNYNEDRVSIILNIGKPDGFNGGYWPRCSLFAIYDGHSGNGCANYLRDNFHLFIIENENFPLNPCEAIRKAFEHAEKDFYINHALNYCGELKDRSGSCAIAVLVVDEIVYVANVGDSRAIMSKEFGRYWSRVTVDHKPEEQNEKRRIEENGGRVYQSYSLGKFINIPDTKPISDRTYAGPSRVFPGRLSVSRTVGDSEPKNPCFNGITGVIVSTPDIFIFKYTSDIDFILIGCDGIFDQLGDKEIIEAIWNSLKEASLKTKNFHLHCGVVCELIIRASLARKSLDNVTCILICFSNFEKAYNAPNVNLVLNKPLQMNLNNTVSNGFTSRESESGVQSERIIVKSSSKANLGSEIKQTPYREPINSISPSDINNGSCMLRSKANERGSEAKTNEVMNLSSEIVTGIDDYSPKSGLYFSNEQASANELPSIGTMGNLANSTKSTLQTPKIFSTTITSHLSLANKRASELRISEINDQTNLLKNPRVDSKSPHRNSKSRNFNRFHTVSNLKANSSKTTYKAKHKV